MITINDCAKEIALESNTTNWLAWRKGGIGASEVPSIMGESPYQTAKWTWEIKTGRRESQPSNFFTEHGHRNEPLARAAYIAQYESIVPHTYQSLRVPYMRASLDGINFDMDRAVEIKCPVKPTIFTLAVTGQVAQYYRGQVQAQIWVSGVKSAHFWVWYQGEGVLVEVLPDAAYHARMLVQCERFWFAVVNDQWPWEGYNQIPETCDLSEVARQLPGATLDLSDDPEWTAAAAMYRAAKERASIAHNDLEIAGAILKRKAVGDNTIGAGVRVHRFKRAGAVDYKQIPAVSSMSKAELDKFRKADIPITEIDVIGL